MSCAREKQSNCPRLTCPEDQQFNVQGQCCTFCRGDPTEPLTVVLLSRPSATKSRLRRRCFCAGPPPPWLTPLVRHYIVT